MDKLKPQEIPSKEKYNPEKRMQSLADEHLVDRQRAVLCKNLIAGASEQDVISIRSMQDGHEKVVSGRIVEKDGGRLTLEITEPSPDGFLDIDMKFNVEGGLAGTPLLGRFVYNFRPHGEKGSEDPPPNYAFVSGELVDVAIDNSGSDVARDYV